MKRVPSTGSVVMQGLLRLRIAAALVLLLPLGGCLGLGGGKPPPSLLRLTSVRGAPAGASFSGKAGDAVMVMEPETDRRLAVQRVPVQIDDSNVAYLKGAQWVERPSRMFRALLAETLRAKGGQLVLEDDQPVPATGTRLGGKLVELGFDARSQSVVVRYDALRTSPAGVVSTKRFESVVPGVAARPGPVGDALNRAANDVAAQVATWIGDQ